MPIMYICRACGEKFYNMKGLQIHCLLTADPRHHIEVKRIKSSDRVVDLLHPPMDIIDASHLGSVSKLTATLPSPDERPNLTPLPGAEDDELPVLRTTPAKVLTAAEEAEKIRRELRLIDSTV